VRRFPPHKTLLHVACELRLATAARQLVEAGADVNAKADDGSTPLMSTYSADLAKLLLDSGADAELTEGRGRNALYIACRDAKADVAKLLLKRGSAVSITQATSDGATPLYAAVSSKSEGLALLVLAAHPPEYDGNEALQAPNVDTILYRAASGGFVKLAEALLKRGADVNRGCIGQRTRTPYMYAAQEGHLAMLDLLQQYGADVNAVASDGATALGVAISSGQTLVAKCMIRHGVNVSPHLVLVDKTSPLYGAVIKGHLGIVTALLNADAQPCCTATVMLEDVLSSLNDDAAVPMLKLLLQHWGTDVNTGCDNGGTLIFAAVVHKRLKAACYLVSAGADLRAKDVHGNTVMHAAALYDAVRLLRWLIVTHKLDPCEAAAGGSQPLPVHLACQMGSTASVEYLLSLPQAAAMLTAEDNEGYTALHYAADSEHDDIVQLLLRKGAAVDARSHNGVTPLMQAQLIRTVRVLLGAHADVNAADANGRTAALLCKTRSSCVYL
jgi:ankyrin repeat protein